MPNRASAMERLQYRHLTPGNKGNPSLHIITITSKLKAMITTPIANRTEKDTRSFEMSMMDNYYFADYCETMRRGEMKDLSSFYMCIILLNDLFPIVSYTKMRKLLCM